VRIEMIDAAGRSIFGAIEQVVTRCESGLRAIGSGLRETRS
jgi:hypothetical protein